MSRSSPELVRLVPPGPDARRLARSSKAMSSATTVRVSTTAQTDDRASTSPARYAVAVTTARTSPAAARMDRTVTLTSLSMLGSFGDPGQWSGPVATEGVSALVQGSRDATSGRVRRPREPVDDRDVHRLADPRTDLGPGRGSRPPS